MAPAIAAAVKRAAQIPRVASCHSNRIETNLVHALRKKEVERVATTKIAPIVLQRRLGSLKSALKYEGDYPGGGSV
jgi:hypothetical protein